MVISKTPLRISFVGGGTDLASYYKKTAGKVISTAINKYIYVIVKKRIDDLIVLHYTKNEIVTTIDQIEHEIIRECMRMVGLAKGIEIITLSDITTQGSGLGSSSVLTVGLLNAMYAYKGIAMNNYQLAEQACEIEIDILKKAIGKQDQYIASFGGINKFIFHSDEKVTVKKIELSEVRKSQLKKNIFIYNTNITRKAVAILVNQVASAEQNERLLDAINGLVEILEEKLAAGELDSLGLILDENWQLKKQLAQGISTKGIDEMVEKAKFGGATGCKIAGAGGGGYLISYVPENRHGNFIQAMKDYTHVEIDFEDQGSKIVFNLM